MNGSNIEHRVRTVRRELSALRGAAARRSAASPHGAEPRAEPEAMRGVLELEACTVCLRVTYP